MESGEETIWLVLDEKGQAFHTIVGNDYQKSFDAACKLLGKKPEQISLMDSGRKKKPCCGKGTP